MAESESNSHLAAPGDGDVERLLREAESLTQEVARETGTPIRDADALLSGELPAPPDPLAAVDAASASIMSLEDLLGEMGPGATEGESSSSPKAIPAAPALAGKPASSHVRQALRASGESSKSNGVDTSASRRGPRVEHMPGEESASASPAEDAASQQYAASGMTSTRAPQEKTPKAPAIPIGRRVLQLGKSGARSLKTFVLIIVRDAPIGLLAFLDIPFRRTPRPIKNVIGILGAITLAMGILAWALPGLMRPKPATPSGQAHAEAPAE